MTQQPITPPPPELVEQWANDSVPYRANATGKDWETAFAMRAAQWGADQELDACCEWVSKYLPYLGDFPMPEDKLRAARRPQPPSAIAQAEALIERFEDGWCPSPAQWNVIREGLAEGRRALESISDPS